MAALRQASASHWQVTGRYEGPFSVSASHLNAFRTGGSLKEPPVCTAWFHSREAQDGLRVAVPLDNDSLTDVSPLIHGLVRRNRPSDWHLCGNAVVTKSRSKVGFGERA